MVALLSMLTGAARAESYAPARTTLWISPLLPSAVGLLLVGGPIYSVAVGAQVPLDEHLLHFDLTFAHTPGGSGRFSTLSRGTGVSASMGYVFANRDKSGPFFTPKLTVAYSSAPFAWLDDEDHFFTPKGASTDLTVGFEVGYQFHHGAFFIAPVLGLSAGYGFGDGNIHWQNGGVNLLNVSGAAPGPLLLVNLNILRLGGSF
jgi:hypothetical protein